MTLFGDWLKLTKELQESAFNVDYDRFSTDPARPDNVADLVQYISWNTKAAMHELVELDQETSWKPWQHDDPYANREQIKGEAIDVLHFVANILAAIDVTADELNAAYLHKMNVNRERQLGEKGYYVLADGVKCRTCRRALDDVEADLLDPTVCVECARLPKKGLY